MAIQIRRGTDAQWESTNTNIVAGEPAIATDTGRFFVGTGSGTYAEFMNARSVAPTYDTSRAYAEGDYVIYNGKFYVCTTATTGGAWNAASWEETSITEALSNDFAYRGYETTTLSGRVVSLKNGAGGIPVKELILDFTANQEGSGTPSPTNIRNITGWLQPRIHVDGKNLIRLGEARSNKQTDVTFTFDGNGGVSASGTPAAARQVNVMYTQGVKGVPVGVPLTLSYSGTTGESRNRWGMRLCWTLTNGGSTQMGNILYDSSASVTTTIPANAYTSWFRLYAPAGVTLDPTAVAYPMLQVASDTDRTYELFKGSSQLIELGQTVYGGTLNVTTGILTITHEMFDGGDVDWIKFENHNYRTFAANVVDKYLYDANTPTAISSQYESVCNNIGMTSSGDNYVAVAAISNKSYVIVKDTSKASMTAEEFKTAMTGVQFVAKLVSSQVATVQLEPVEVRTLLGQNNIWAGSGSLDVTVRLSKVL